MVKTDCHFLEEYDVCGVLTKQCDGKCTFYKTEKQFIKDQDDAILICRKQDKCVKCQYSNSPCRLSTEAKPKMSG